MRVIKLRMTAFGPFPRTQEIDFTRLGSHPLFLINGPTGSGKTTILDAICFALYGETTGTEREGKEMRCDQADLAHETSVELVFELGAQRYRILRFPEQERPKRKAEGTTKRAAEAQLFQVGVDAEETVLVPRKTGDANRKIVELTGLSGEQFRQIMVLPQGKFRNFLLASSEERQKIFVTLFGTEIYSRLEVKLKENAIRFAREVKALIDQQAGMLRPVGLETTDELKDAIADKESAVEDANTAMTQAANVLAAAQTQLVEAQKNDRLFADLEAALKHLQDLSAQENVYNDLSEILDLARRAREIRPVLERREEREGQHRDALKWESGARSSLDAADLGSREAQAAWKTAETDMPRLEKLKEERTALEKHRGRVAKLSVALDELDQTVKQQTTASDEVRAASGRRDLAAGELEHLKKAREKLEKNAIDYPIIQGQVDDLKRLNKDLAALAKHSARLGKVEQRYAEDEASLHSAGDRLDNLAAERAVLEKQWSDGQAAILAQQLIPGDPCPVCGSTDHPLPAHPDTDLPTEQDIERAKSAEEKARADRDELSAKLAGLKVEREESSRQFADMLAHLGDKAEMSVAIAEEQLETAEARLAALVDAPGRLESHKKQLAAVELTLKQRDDELAKAGSDLDDVRRTEATVREKVRGIEEELPELFREPGALETEIDNLNIAIANLERVIEEARRRAEQKKLVQAEAKTNLDNAGTQLEKAAKLLERAQEEWSKTLLASKFDDEAQVRASILPPDDIAGKEIRLKGYNDKKLLATGELRRLTGETGGKIRPDVDSIRNAEAEAREQYKARAEHCTRHMEQLDQLRKIASELEKLKNTRQKLEAEYKVVGTISNVASGQNAYRTSLQRFVLGVLLDDVLIEAGQKLQKMSRGRYQLRRSDELADRRSAAGLDLVVDDAYTGKHRGVATLSGGESFLAALSLALGLSAVVQAYAGGVRLDTLFIDEGFGSLDSEALDLAINTLLDLQSSGITVGVISHVSELRERMDTRVDLHTGQQGSRVEIVTP